MSPRSPADVATDVTCALAEDIGDGDLTAALIPERAVARAAVVMREAAVVCGRAWFDETFRQLNEAVTIEWQAQECEQVAADTIVCRLAGPARSLLSGERTALNFLQTLSGTATATRRYVDAIAGTACRILDTRKTIPGLRLAQKYAVRCGGGTNHRLGLFDAILVKENHIAAAGSLSAAVASARSVAGSAMVEVEGETLEELEQALATDVDRIMLDEFSLPDMRRAVALARATPGRPVELEASGNVSLETIRAIAETGVDYVSVGAITKHVKAIDVSMRFLDDS